MTNVVEGVLTIQTHDLKCHHNLYNKNKYIGFGLGVDCFHHFYNDTFKEMNLQLISDRQRQPDVQLIVPLR